MDRTERDDPGGDPGVLWTEGEAMSKKGKSRKCICRKNLVRSQKKHPYNNQKRPTYDTAKYDGSEASEEA